MLILHLDLSTHTGCIFKGNIIFFLLLLQDLCQILDLLIDLAILTLVVLDSALKFANKCVQLLYLPIFVLKLALEGTIILSLFLFCIIFESGFQFIDFFKGVPDFDLILSMDDLSQAFHLFAEVFRGYYIHHCNLLFNLLKLLNLLLRVICSNKRRLLLVPVSFLMMFFILTPSSTFFLVMFSTFAFVLPFIVVIWRTRRSGVWVLRCWALTVRAGTARVKTIWVIRAVSSVMFASMLLSFITLPSMFRLIVSISSLDFLSRNACIFFDSVKFLISDLLLNLLSYSHSRLNHQFLDRSWLTCAEMVESWKLFDKFETLTQPHAVVATIAYPIQVNLVIVIFCF